MAQGRAAAPHWPQEQFHSVDCSFLNRLGRLAHDPDPATGPYDALVEDFLEVECQERGLALATRNKQHRHIRQFLFYLSQQSYSLEGLTPDDIDAYLAHLGQTWSRVSLGTIARVLRAWFRHCEIRGKTRPGLADSILVPRIYRHEGLPLGPTLAAGLLGRAMETSASTRPEALKCPGRKNQTARGPANGVDCGHASSKDILARLFEGRVEFFSFDANYLQRLRDRDFQTEQHFVAYFGKLLLIKLRSRLRSSPAVEDIRQETFVRVLKTLRADAGIRNPERLGAFVNSVCNNVLQEFYRSSARGAPLDENTEDPPDQTIDLDGMLMTKQTREQVRQILARLPEKDRQLLRAIFLEERDKNEVCRELGVNRDYLRVLLHRAKQSFRAFYEKSGLDGRMRVGQ